MAFCSSQKSCQRCWLWLLLIPLIGIIWVPLYNRIEPTLWGFPFFYWSQLAWTLISALIIGLVYVKTKRRNIDSNDASNTQR